MATRFYLPWTGTTDNAPVSPAFSTEWTITSSAERVMMYTTKTNTALTSDSPGVSSERRLYKQYVSLPMAAGNSFASGTINYSTSIRCNQSSTAANSFICFFVHIYSEDGATLRDAFGAMSYDGTEMLTTAIQSRYHTTTSTGISYTTVDGDRLVFEIGYDRSPWDGLSYTTTFNFGDNAAADLDAADADTGADNPWFEVSNNIVFKTDGVPNQLMMTGCGT